MVNACPLWYLYSNVYLTKLLDIYVFVCLSFYVKVNFKMYSYVIHSAGTHQESHYKKVHTEGILQLAYGILKRSIVGT